MKAADNKIFPTRFLKSSYNSPTFIFHLTDSFPNPLNSFSALASWISASFYCFNKLSDSFRDASKEAFNSANISFTSFNLFYLMAN